LKIGRIFALPVPTAAEIWNAGLIAADDTCMAYLIACADLRRFLPEARHKRKPSRKAAYATRDALKF